VERVLVTGTSGLIGYRVAGLLAAGGTPVQGFDLRPPPAGAPFPAQVGSLADGAAVAAAMRGCDAVVHVGAVSGPMLMLDDPAAVAGANVGGCMAVFAAAHRAGVRRLVWASSIAVYGDQETLDPVTEDAPLHPASFYADTKVAGEALLRGYVRHYGLDAIALRLSTVYAPDRQTPCAIRDMIVATREGRPVPVSAPGSGQRQYIHADDAARAMLLALAAPPDHQFAYNITGSTWLAEAEVADRLRALLPAMTITQGPAAWSDGHLGPLVIEAARRDLGYAPQIDLRDGLAEMVQHVA
jgi:UDP-glucuronate 4-epimerase